MSRPSQEALAVRHPGTEARHLDVLKWGLRPYWTRDRPLERDVRYRFRPCSPAPETARSDRRRRVNGVRSLCERVRGP
jgi:putative SOS response-associated peptidase YedK